MNWQIPDDQLPSVPELMAAGGKLLVALVLREMPYAEYLKTEHWHQVREAAFKMHGCRCFVCLASLGLEIHHITYDRKGCEPPEDTVPLCPEHHQIQHAILRHILHAEFERQFRS